jgi:hypothetical protein
MDDSDGRDIRLLQPPCGNQTGKNEIRNEYVWRIIMKLLENPRDLILEIVRAASNVAPYSLLPQFF